MAIKKCMSCGGSMKKMQEGGIPPAPSRMQYVEAARLKNKKKYYTPDNIYIGDPKKKKEIDAMIEKKTKADTKGMDFSGKKKMAKGGIVQKGGDNLKDGIYGIPNAGRTDSLGFKKGGSVVKKYQSGGTPKPTLKPLNGRANVVLRNKPNTGIKPKITLKKGKFGASVPVQHSPAPGRVRSASGVGTVPVGKRKVGGTVSASKFAALAPPYNKATFADKIVGAKKTKKK